jgi:hypothetical protein
MGYCYNSYSGIIRTESGSSTRVGLDLVLLSPLGNNKIQIAIKNGGTNLAEFVDRIGCLIYPIACFPHSMYVKRSRLQSLMC